MLLIYQAYEWAIMINLILYQKGKQVNEIMFKMSNKASRDAFRKREKCIKIAANSFIPVFVILRLISISIVFKINDTSYRNSVWRIISYSSVCICAILIGMGVTLLKLLKKYYFFAYQSKKNNSN